MALPASQERILHRMETSLRTHEPRLAAIFAVFTRLTKDEEIPQIERMAPQPWLSGHRLHRTASAGRALARRRRAGRQAGPRRDQPWSRFAHTPRVLLVVLVAWFVVISVSLAVGVSSRRSCGQPAVGLAAAAQARAWASGARWTLTRQDRCRPAAGAGKHP